MSAVDVEALRSSVDLVDIISKYGVQLTKVGGEFRALCPFHDDHSPSLTVHQGKQVWACFACGAHEVNGADVFGFVRSYEQCTFPEAIAKLQNGHGGNGATPPIRPALKKPPARRTFPHPEGEEPNMVHRDFGPPVKVWVIRERDARPNFYEARYMHEGKKETRFWTWGNYSDDDPPRWECRHPANPRPFFGLEDIDRRPEAQVMIHEAPKKAEAARAIFPKQVHLALVGGAHQVANMDVTPLSGRRCMLLPDNDEAGREAMKRLSLRLWDAGAIEVKGIDPETQPDGSLTPPSWDIADAEGWTPSIALEWAKNRKLDYAAPDASEAPPPPEVATAPVAATAQDAPERAESALPEPAPKPSRKRPIAKPALATVDGSAVRKAWDKIEPEPDQLPALSEFALATRFADTHGADWRHTAAWSTWYRWDGVRWAEDMKKAWTWAGRECCAAAMVEKLAESTPSQRMKVTSLKTVNAVMGLAAADPRIAVSPDSWDADPMALGTPGGIVDLRTGELAPGQRDQMISKCTSVVPAAGAHPWWDRVLARAGAPREFLQRWCGYMLTGDTREERFLFIHGPGAGGKSKFLTPLAEILGDYRRTAKMESFTAKDRSEHSEEIARLAGARLVTATETADGSRWNEARITALTGRDAIAARFMRQGTFEFQPQFKLVFVGNHRPALRSVGEEMRRRIDLIEWGGTIPEADRVLDLPAKLREEYPAILAWMIEGCLAWQREGLGRPEQIQAATRDYLSAEDSLGAWLEDCTDADPMARTQSSAAYRSFRKWAENAGEFVPSQKRFTGSVRDRGFQTVKASGIYFIGFRIKRDDYSDQQSSWVPD